MDDPARLVVQGCHALAADHQDHFVFGHVSVRLDDDLVDIKAAGHSMASVGPDQVARVDLNGTTRSPHLRLHDETAMHLAVYRARRDVRAVVHTHPVAAHAASLLGPPDGVYSQDQIPFAGGDLTFHDSALLVNDEARAAAVAASLGAARAALLRGHGMLVVGGSVEEAVVLAVMLDRAMRILLTARAAGRPAPLRDDEVAELRAAFDRTHDARIRDVWRALVSSS